MCVIQAEREKMETEEFMTKTSAQKTSLDRTVLRLEDENTELRQHIQTLQAQLSQVEEDHTQRLHFILWYLPFCAIQAARHSHR